LSLARGNFHAGSDIDLCVEGLPRISFFQAIGERLRDIESPVSIAPRQNTWGYFRQRILQEGKVIYEQ
jgi:predicted nucleotidyltransferase